MSARRRAPRRASGARLLALGALGICAAAAAAELALRAASGDPFDVENRLERDVRLAENNCAADWDPRLGWAPTPLKSGRENARGTAVTILDGGLRGNGPGGKTAGKTVLAVGDSYTFGDEVSDADTWPAQLERSSDYRVLNAGVCAYGVDQIYLRLEQLLPRVKPRVVVFGLIDLALMRAQIAAFPTPVGAKGKPYFRRAAGRWEAAGLPVAPTPPRAPLGGWRRYAGESFLVDAVLRRLAPDAWRVADSSEEPAYTGEDGVAIACALLAKLPRLTAPAKTIVLLERRAGQGEGGQRLLDAARSCAEKAGLAVVEPTDIPESLFLPGGHLSREGNRRVAETLARALRSRAAPPTGAGGT